MDQNITDLFRFCQLYKPQQVGIEVSGQQGGFISWIQNEMLARNVFFTLASDSNGNKPGIRPNTNKMQRFNIVVPFFKLGKMYFPEELKHEPIMCEAMVELTLAAANGFRSKHDDFIDTISMLSVMQAIKPSKTESFEYSETDKVWKAKAQEEESGSSIIF